MLDETIAVPRHLGFILDGNRRWAHSHHLPEFEGHLAGYAALKTVLHAVFDFGIPYVTIYAFSTENWQRDGRQVSRLMRLVVKAVTSDLSELVANRVRVRFLGRLDGLSKQVIKAIEKAEAKTRDFTQGTLAICFNYGGQQEIVDAVKQCLRDGLGPDDINEQAIAARLYAPDVPPLDIVVRTSGEQRLSNFMLWRSHYSELLFIEKYWPDMTKQDVADIIKEYNHRLRRFGA
jgi:undecaprenyl diphosphate synthase